MTGRYSIVALVLVSAMAYAAAPSASDRVRLERVPGGGIQPQAVTDATGVVHIVYYKGDPAAGDLYYVRRALDGTYSKAVRVNSQGGSAIAIASVRGAQIAVGRGNRPHVVWNGSDRAKPRPQHGMPMLYSRLNDTGDAFEPQRNLITWSEGIDGGGAVAADKQGHVLVAWHANTSSGDDASAAVYLTRSEDDGRGFAREERVSAPELGACACCSMRALLAQDGSLYIVYRAAGHGIDRDMMLLSSRDRGTTFSAAKLQAWKLQACPLSSAFLAEGPRGVTAAWESQGQVFFANIAAGAKSIPSPETPPGSGDRKHPVVVYNDRGEELVAWLEGTAWARGGSVAWQLYDREGHATPERGSAHGVPVWGLATGAPLPDGRFLVLY